MDYLITIIKQIINLFYNIQSFSKVSIHYIYENHLR